MVGSPCFLHVLCYSYQHMQIILSDDIEKPIITYPLHAVVAKTKTHEN